MEGPATGHGPLTETDDQAPGLRLKFSYYRILGYLKVEVLNLLGFSFLIYGMGMTGYRLNFFLFCLH